MPKAKKTRKFAIMKKMIKPTDQRMRLSPSSDEEWNVDGAESTDSDSTGTDSEIHKSTGNVFPSNLSSDISDGESLRKENSGATKHRLEDQKKKRNNQRRPMIKGCCKTNCTYNCHKTFSESERQQINTEYWDVAYHRSCRKVWLLNYVKRTSRKIVYTLKKPSGQTKRVCKKYFLETLGYTHNAILRFIFTSIKPKRALRLPGNIDKEYVKSHIESFYSAILHFSCEEESNVKYLPSDLSLKRMYDHFTTQNPHFDCSYVSYCKTFEEMRARFAEPDYVCLACLYYESNSSKENKMKITEHYKRGKDAKTEYKNDHKIYEHNENVLVFAVDMQNNLLLPRMPDILDSYLCSRMVTFNQTFASVQAKKKHYCVLWNESTRGRNLSDVTSAYVRIIEEHRDTAQFIFWADHSAGVMNKNFALYSAFALLVNQEDGPTEITMKYLVRGHAPFAVDKVYNDIEQAIGDRKNVYDMNNLCQAIVAANKEICILKMELDHFNEYETVLKDQTIQLDISLQDICETRFVKGLQGMVCKKTFDESGDIIPLELNYLPGDVVRPRGMLNTKLVKIKSDLVPLMPLCHQAFWQNLPTKSKIADLLSSRE